MNAPLPATSPHSPLRWVTALMAPLALTLAWDLTGLDLALAHLSGNAQGFALRDQWWLSGVLHQGARTLGWAVLLGLTLTIWRPVGLLTSLTRRERAWMVGSMYLALLAVVTLKGLSTTSCPWDLQVFGGSAQHVSHWAWGQLDGGGGHCFPAGHASTAFAFLGAYPWLRRHHARAAHGWLMVVLVLGTVLGLAQQVRGAHFMSHTLWSAWLCWAVALLTHRWTHQPQAVPSTAPALS
jgi:membrane-associated PAP2 superfamily phosphatase